MKGQKVRDVVHKSGVVILIPDYWTHGFTRWALGILPEEDLYFPTKEETAQARIDQPCVKVHRKCRDSDHFAFQCPTRLPLVFENEVYPMISWDRWIEKYTGAQAPDLKKEFKRR